MPYKEAEKRADVYEGLYEGEIRMENLHLKFNPKDFDMNTLEKRKRVWAEQLDNIRKEMPEEVWDKVLPKDERLKIDFLIVRERKMIQYEIFYDDSLYSTKTGFIEKVFQSAGKEISTSNAS